MYRRAYLSFFIAFLLIAIPVVFLIRSFQAMTDTNEFVEEQHQSLHLWERLLNYFKSAEILTPAFEEFRDNRFYREYLSDYQSIPGELENLSHLLTDSLQLARVDSVKDIFIRNREWIISGADTASESQKVAEILLVHRIIERAIERSNILLAQRQKDDLKAIGRTELMVTILIVTGLIILVLSMVSLVEQLKRRRILITQLDAKNEELDARNKELEAFSFISSHHFQEPVRIISSYVQLLQRRYKDRLDQQANEYIGFTVQAAARMKALLKDILKYLNISWNPSRENTVDCNVVLKNVIDGKLKDIIASNQATIQVNSLPAIRAEESMIYLLFEELILNAIKFKGNADPEIFIAGEKVNDGFQFSVRDNGMGMDNSYNKKVFTIFQRLHSGEKYPGTGIGLSICKKIVEAHGGKIWYVSKPDSGTTFFFTINDI